MQGPTPRPRAASAVASDAATTQSNSTRSGVDAHPRVLEHPHVQEKPHRSERRRVEFVRVQRLVRAVARQLTARSESPG